MKTLRFLGKQVESLVIPSESLLPEELHRVSVSINQSLLNLFTDTRRKQNSQGWGHTPDFPCSHSAKAAT